RVQDAATHVLRSDGAPAALGVGEWERLAQIGCPLFTISRVVAEVRDLFRHWKTELWVPPHVLKQRRCPRLLRADDDEVKHFLSSEMCRCSLRSLRGTDPDTWFRRRLDTGAATSTPTRPSFRHAIDRFDIVARCQLVAFTLANGPSLRHWRSGPSSNGRSRP